MPIRDKELDEMQKIKVGLIKKIDKNPADKAELQRQLKNINARIKTRSDNLTASPTVATPMSKALIETKKAEYKEMSRTITQLMKKRQELREAKKKLMAEIEVLKNAN